MRAKGPWVARSVAFLAATLVGSVGPGLCQEILHRFEGTQLIEQVGRGDQVGDLDSDGVPDIVSLEGMERVVFRSGADGSILDMADPDPEYRGSRTVVAGIGDFDGDGVPDVLVGASSAHIDQSLGRVDILSGASTERVFSVDGTLVDGYLGRSIAAVGDVDGDGYADALFIGFRGDAQLRFGPDGSRVRTHPSVGFGVSVAAVGDVDADGYPDYAVGSPLLISPGLGNAGALDVYSGIDGTLLRRIVGNRPQGYLGGAATAAGDLDGDGYGDILVGMPGNWETIGPGFGMARVYSGADTSILWSFEPPTNLPESFGFGMCGGKDFTGDGVADWVIGSPFARRPEGGRPGGFYFFDGASGSLIWKVYGEENSIGRMGLHVFLADDMNGDGLSEIGYGDLSAELNGVIGAGYLAVIAGAPGGASTFCTARPNSTGRRAKIGWEGPIGVKNNEWTLLVRDAIPGAFGLFFYGPESRSVPFGDGIRCVGGRAQRLFPPISIDSDGGARRALDFTQAPAWVDGPSPILPGSTKYFQFWYRDQMGVAGSGFNLSDGIRVLFAP